MKSFFDTSVLIAAFLGDHEHHEASFAVFTRANRKDSCCAAHTLAEVYSCLTRLPGKHRLTGEQAMLFVETLSERLLLISLDGTEYFSALQHAAEAATTEGATHDALLAHCALKAKAETIYTWNLGHFRRLGQEVSRRIRTP